MSVTWKRSVGRGVAAGAALMWTGPVAAQELAPEGRIGEGDGPILGNVSDLGFLSDGRLVISTRRGQVWIVEDPLGDDFENAKVSLFHEGLWEGLGLVFLEAMATEIPVLATRVSARW